MATGTVSYWNGYSGWIKKTVTPDLPTAYCDDVLFTLDAVDSGDIFLGAAVTFDISDYDRAVNITNP